MSLETHDDVIQEFVKRKSVLDEAIILGGGGSTEKLVSNEHLCL